MTLFYPNPGYNKVCYKVTALYIMFGHTLSIEQVYSTANIKALRGSLGALSVNKLSHIPKLQPISAVYENQ